jgi:polysaccharide export outer membrane protein
MLRSVRACILLSFGATGLAAYPGEIPSKELIQYVKDAKKAGLRDDQIEGNAIKAGWSRDSVKSAIQDASNSSTKTAELKDAKHQPTNSQVQSEAALTSNALAAKAETDAVTPVSAPNPNTASTESASAPAAGPLGVPSSTPATSIRQTNRGVPNEYRIGEGDIVQINVWGERDASVPSAVVRPDGMITVPLIKDIRVAGMTPAEAEKVITEQLVKQIKAADVTVIVNQINSKKIYVVGGGVKKEGPIPYTYRMTVMQALSEAGGLSDYAKRKKIYVLRTENGREFKLSFDYDAVLRGERMDLNIPLMPGDTLVVPNH